MGSGVGPCTEPGGGSLVAVVLEPGGTNRFDPCRASGVCVFDTFTAEAVVHGRNHPCRERRQYIGHSMQHGSPWA